MGMQPPMQLACNGCTSACNPPHGGCTCSLNRCTWTLNGCARRRASLHLRVVAAPAYTSGHRSATQIAAHRDGDQTMSFAHLFLAIAALAGVLFIAATAPAHAQFPVAAGDAHRVLR